MLTEILGIFTRGPYIFGNSLQSRSRISREIVSRDRTVWQIKRLPVEAALMRLIIRYLIVLRHACLLPRDLNGVIEVPTRAWLRTPRQMAPRKPPAGANRLPAWPPLTWNRRRNLRIAAEARGMPLGDFCNQGSVLHPESLRSSRTFNRLRSIHLLVRRCKNGRPTLSEMKRKCGQLSPWGVVTCQTSATK